MKTDPHRFVCPLILKFNWIKAFRKYAGGVPYSARVSNARPRGPVSCWFLLIWIRFVEATVERFIVKQAGHQTLGRL